MKVSELYSRCVPFISPSEFWELDGYRELELALDGIELYHAPVVNMLRMNCYVCAQTHSKKRVTPLDFHKFSWECEKEEEKEKEERLSREQVIERVNLFKKIMADFNEKN